MTKNNIVLILGILISAYFFVQPNFGFRPISDALSFGQNVVPLIIYLETIFLARGFIKNFVSKRPTLLEKLKYFAPRRILFPFYKSEKHHFLIEKWWFRLFFVLYIIFLVALVIWIWTLNASSLWGWCYDSLPSFLDFKNNFQDNSAFNERFAYCKTLFIENLPTATLISLGSAILVNYFVQLVFFKIIINYIVLGNSKNKKYEL